MKYSNVVLPNYEHCVLGTISSILKYYGVETQHKTNEMLDKKLTSKNYRNVVFLVLDGMGEHILNRISNNGFLKQHQVDMVTSVYPSTTTAALTTYYSGKPPYETGWIAWTQYFKEYGRTVEMLTHKEAYYRQPFPKKPLLDIYEKVIKYKAIFEQIENAACDVKAYEIIPDYSDRRAARNMRANNIDELIVDIEDLITKPGRNFILAYSDNPDGLLHKFGTDSDEVRSYLLATQEKIKSMCEKFSDDTILIISADHGHKNIDKAYTLLDYPEIQECLIMPASLESRVVTFWVKDDKREVFVERFNKVFEKEFWLMTKDEFLNEYHMLGFGKKHYKIDDFIGNYVAVSVAGSIIRLETFLTEGKPVMKSTHCGITKEEMEVPLIVYSK